MILYFHKLTKLSLLTLDFVKSLNTTDSQKYLKNTIVVPQGRDSVLFIIILFILLYLVPFVYFLYLSIVAIYLCCNHKSNYSFKFNKFSVIRRPLHISAGLLHK